MKSYLRCNFAIILLLTILKCLLSRGGLHIIPLEEIDNEEFNPFNAFLNFDRMAKEMMSKLKKYKIKIRKKNLIFFFK